MNNTKPILYDLGVSIGAISLWLVPADVVKMIGYSTSFVFAGDAYLRGLTLLSKERRTDEKTAIAYEAETDFYDQLLSQTTEAKLEIAALEVETRMLEKLIPLVERKNRLEQQISQVVPRPSDEVSDVVEPETVVEAVEVDFRSVFPESMDSTSWRAICKGLGEGLGRSEIVKDILGCSNSQTGIGTAYFEFLKERFLNG